MTDDQDLKLTAEDEAVVRLVDRHTQWGERGREEKLVFEHRIRERIEQPASWFGLRFGKPLMFSGGLAGAACAAVLVYALFPPAGEPEPQQDQGTSFLVAAYYDDNTEADAEEGGAYLTPELRVWSDSLDGGDQG